MLICAGTGADEIYGNVLNETIDGGTGNDLLNVGLGDDVYIFHKGDGKDTIVDYDLYSCNRVDTVVFADIAFIAFKPLKLTLNQGDQRRAA